jgi:hypothetical protein
VLYAVFGLFPAMYVVLGIMMISGAMGPPPKGPPPELGIIFLVGGLLAVAIAEGFALGVVVAGRSLARYKRYTFCFVMSILLCISGVPGVILGVFTIIVLVRDSVKELFAHGDAGPALDEAND